MLDFNTVHEKVSAAAAERDAAYVANTRAREEAYEALRARETDFYTEKCRLDETHEIIASQIQERYRAAVEAATAED